MRLQKEIDLGRLLKAWCRLKSEMDDSEYIAIYKKSLTMDIKRVSYNSIDIQHVGEDCPEETYTGSSDTIFHARLSSDPVRLSDLMKDIDINIRELLREGEKKVMVPENTKDKNPISRYTEITNHPSLCEVILKGDVWVACRNKVSGVTTKKEIPFSDIMADLQAWKVQDTNGFKIENEIVPLPDSDEFKIGNEIVTLPFRINIEHRRPVFNTNRLIPLSMFQPIKEAEVNYASPSASL